MPVTLNKKMAAADEAHALLLNYYLEYEDAYASWRPLAVKDIQFYHNRQWTAEEIRVLEERAQPIVTINKIAPKVNYVIGSEARNRVQPHAYPRTPKHEDDAMLAADAIRAVTDQQQFARKRSETFKDMIIPGAAALLVTPRPAADDDYEIQLRQVPWDRFFFDPHSLRADFSDALYLGLVVWRDLDEALAEFSEDGTAIGATRDLVSAISDPGAIGIDADQQAHQDAPRSWYDTARKRVKIIEIYYKDGADWKMAIFTRAGFIHHPATIKLVDDRGYPYCPLIGVSAYVDEEGRRYGIVRGMISPQEEINKRRSKALHLLNNRQVLAEDGAVPNENEAQIELAKGDGWVRVSPNALKEARFQVAQTADLAQGQLALLQEAKSEIDTIGPHAAFVASTQREMSGRAFLAQQEAGGMELGEIEDNLHDWTLRVYRAIWYQIRQFKTADWWLRVTDDATLKGYRFVHLNEAVTRGERLQQAIQAGVNVEEAVSQAFGDQGAQIAQTIAQQAAQQGIPPDKLPQLITMALLRTPQANEKVKIRDVAAIDVDILLETGPDSVVAQQEEFALLVDIVKSGHVQIPQDLIIESSNLRNKRKILERLRQPPDPQQVQAQQQMMQLQLQQLAAVVQKLQADAQKVAAQAAKAQVEAQLGVPAEAKKDLAQAAGAAADAGNKMVPDMEPERPST